MANLSTITEGSSAKAKDQKQKDTASRADTLPSRSSSKAQQPRRQISNPVQRSASHTKDQSSKARPVNTNRLQRQASGMSARPGIQRSETSYRTRYIDMLLGLDTIPRIYNILASFFSWVLLAGFVVFPGTFTSIEDFSDRPDVQANEAASAILKQVKNIPLLVIAAIACGFGAAGLIWLSIRWRQNYVWLLNRLYLPGVTNSMAGLISTLIAVYTQQQGAWSVTAKVTAIVEGCCLGVCLVLFVLYNNLLLKQVKRRHGRDMEKMERGDEGLLEKAERKLAEPALEPGSVI